MTAVYTYFYIVVDTQRGCHTLRKITWTLFKMAEFEKPNSE